jgi:hypothetical protein
MEDQDVTVPQIYLMAHNETDISCRMEDTLNLQSKFTELTLFNKKSELFSKTGARDVKDASYSGDPEFNYRQVICCHDFRVLKLLSGLPVLKCYNDHLLL